MSQAAIRDGRRRLILLFVAGLAFAIGGNLMARATLVLGLIGSILGTLGALAALYAFIGLVVWIESPRAVAAANVPEPADAAAADR